MRIRKHFRLTSPLAGATAGDTPRLQSPICRLNQPPWDVFDPSSSLPQDTKEDIFPGNGGSSSNNSIGTAESVGTIKIPGEESRIVLCGKKNGNNWKCKAEAARGKSFCEHHLEKDRNYRIRRKKHSSSNNDNNNNNNNNNNKKTEEKRGREDQAGGGRGRRVRARKAALSSNPYEQYYYYSGFGPSWGKKRGNNNTKSDGVVAEEVSHLPPPSEMCEIDRIRIDYAEDEDEEEEERSKADQG